MELKRVYLFVLILSMVLTFSKAQYETPNNICGGWFKSVQGSIKFNYSESATLTDQVCAWTVSGSSPSLQYARYNIQISQISGLTCDSNNMRVSISHFSLWDETVTATETWNCGTPLVWNAVPGTVFIVVLKATSLVRNNGFKLEWSPDGDALNRHGVRTTQYTWGKPNVDPLPYYAAHFFTEEVATHVFPKGNNTRGYQLQIEFDNIKLDQCDSSKVNCTGTHASKLLLCSIEPDARLKVQQVFTDEVTTDPPASSSEWGMVILVFVGDFWGAGGSFQMVYRSFRML